MGRALPVMPPVAARRRSPTALSICAARPGAWPMKRTCARRRAEPRTKQSAAPKMPAKLFAMRPAMPVRSFVTLPDPRAKRRRRFSMTRLATPRPLRRWPAKACMQRKLAKSVGPPLLGAFSCAAGAAVFAQIVQPGAITGASISWLLGGNSFLDGVWLFANGVICFHQGYKFFMIALADQEEVKRVVREIKGLLPAAA